MAEVKLVIKEEKRGPPVTKTTGEQLQDLAKTALKVGAGLAAVGVTAKKAFDLANEGAQLNQLTASFEMMNERVFKTPGLLDSMSAAVRGTVKETELMKGLLTLTAGATDEVSRQLAAAAPKLLEIAKASNKLNPALGDTTFLFDSIAKGVKRQSPLILDNLGIVIKLESAYKEYAQSVGKTVKELDSNERVLATLNATMNAGDQLIKQVGGSVDSQADSYAELIVIVGEATEGFKRLMASGLGPVVEAILKVNAATDDSDKGLTKFLLAINALNVAMGGIGVSTEAIKNLTNDYADSSTEAARRTADHTNQLNENTDALDDNSDSIAENIILVGENEQAVNVYQRAGEEMAETLTDMAAQSELAARRTAFFTEQEELAAEAAEKTAEELEEATKKLAEYSAMTGDYFVQALEATKETSLLNVAIEDIGTSMVIAGGRTEEQNQSLDELSKAHERALSTIRSLESGTAGLGLTEEERADKINEQVEAMGQLESAMDPLLQVTGELVAQTTTATVNQEAVNSAFWESVKASEASAEKIGLLGVALGELTPDQAEAALKASILNIEIQKLADMFADSDLTAEDAAEAARILGSEQATTAEEALGMAAAAREAVEAIEEQIEAADALTLALEGIPDEVNVNININKTGGVPTDLGAGAGVGAGVPEFGDGGRFMVGGAGGRDSQPVFFNASPGEEVIIRTPEQQGAAGDLTFTGDIIIQGGGGESMADEFLAALGRKTRSARQAGAGVMGRTF